MTNYTISPKALIDLRDIWLYIASDNINAAELLSNRFGQEFDKICKNPMIGVVRKELTDMTVRFWKVSSYMIIYRINSSEIEIVRVLSSYLNITNAL